MRILAISGGVSEKSRESAHARLVAEVAPAGVEVEVWQHAGKLPLYDHDETFAYCNEAAWLNTGIHHADAVVLTMHPDNGVPASTKNVLEWADSLGTVPTLLLFENSPDPKKAAAQLVEMFANAEIATLELAWNATDEARRDSLRSALVTLVTTASANPQRVRVKTALRAVGHPRRDDWTLVLRREGGEQLPLQAGADVMRSAFGRGATVDAWGRYRLFADAEGRGLLLRNEDPSGNPRDGYGGNIDAMTVGIEVDVRVCLFGSSLGPELHLNEKQRFAMSSDADWSAQQAVRDNLVNMFGLIGFGDATLDSECAGRMLDVVKRHDEATFERLRAQTRAHAIATASAAKERCALDGRVYLDFDETLARVDAGCRWINLSCNRLERVPDSIARFTALEELGLRQNQLSAEELERVRGLVPAGCKIET